MPQPILGVMALYWNNKKQLEERPFFKKLITSGNKLGLDVFIFTPQDVDSANKRIYSHNYDPTADTWKRKWRSFPPVIFDRCRYQPTERFRQLRQFRAKYPDLTYLNRPLGNKWVMSQLFSKHAEIRPYLPATKLYTQTQDVFKALKQHSVVYVKPINGTGGRDIIRIHRLPNRLYLIAGRDPSRRIIRPQQLTGTQLIANLKARSHMKHRYLVQQGIDLKLSSGRVHDYRLLLQKNGKGDWEVTGCAGRIGARNSITSNLHGGGKAESMDVLLREWFSSEDKIKSIKQTSYQLGHDIVRCVENEYGKLCEMALDIAIDRTGHVWLLEINPKPGREVFGKIGEREAYEKAISRPLEYALWIYKQKYGTPG